MIHGMEVLARRSELGGEPVQAKAKYNFPVEQLKSRPMC
jgi:hypothetical protein